MERILQHYRNKVNLEKWVCPNGPQDYPGFHIMVLKAIENIGVGEKFYMHNNEVYTLPH